MTDALRARVRGLLRRSGYDLVTRRPTVVDLLAQRRVDVVLDVGANEGQYAEYLRAWGYRGRVASFTSGPASGRS